MGGEAEDIIRYTPTLQIPLTQGRFATIETADWHLIAGYPWRVQPDKRPGGKIYAVTGHNSKMMHRFIMGKLSDHRNGDGLDNRRSNLRPCTLHQNAMNQTIVRGRYPYKGVHFNRRDACFQAKIGFQRKQHFLGYFDNPITAAIAYDKAARRYFGDFAHTNFEVS